MADTATAPASTEQPVLPVEIRELFVAVEHAKKQTSDVARSDAVEAIPATEQAQAALLARLTAMATLFDVRRVVENVREQAIGKDTVVAQVAALTSLKRELDACLSTTKKELKPREDEILAEYAQEGVTSKRDAESGQLVYTSRKVWARAADGVEKPDACKALKDAGLGDFVAEGFNTQTLSSYFREQVKNRMADGDPVTDLDVLLPEPLRGVIALTDDHTVGVRG